MSFSREPSDWVLIVFMRRLLNSPKEELVAVETHIKGSIQYKIIKTLMERKVFEVIELRDYDASVSFKINTSRESRETMRRYLEYLDL